MREQEQSGSPPPSRPPSLRQAASILVVRDGAAGMEVLLVRRAERNDDRSSGAFVFPGGTLDPQDKTLHEACAGLDDAAASARLKLPDGGLDFYLAAVRECFEEAGLLFASDAGGELIALDTLDATQQAWLRQSARRGGPGMAQLCERLGVRLAVDRLAYHSHWLTPPGLPKRFDTRFFVAMAPAGQSATHDGDEAVEHLWIRPGDAIDPARGLKLVAVTRRTLASIARFDTAQACFDHAAQLRDIARIMPRLAQGSGGLRPVLPSEPAYAEIERIDPLGQGHARYELATGAAVRLDRKSVV